MSDTEDNLSFSAEMALQIKVVDKQRAAQKAMSQEEHALSDSWHSPLLRALMLEMVRKVMLLGSEGLKNEFHFDLTEGNHLTLID